MEKCDGEEEDVVEGEDQPIFSVCMPIYGIRTLGAYGFLVLDPVEDLGALWEKFTMRNVIKIICWYDAQNAMQEMWGELCIIKILIKKGAIF